MNLYPCDGGHVRVDSGAFGTRLTVSTPNGQGTVELRDYERRDLIRALEAEDRG